MAASFVESLSADFDPTRFRDDYREALLAVIDNKLAGGAGLAPTADISAADGDGIVLDLMAALRESVKRTQEARGTQAAPDAPSAKPARKARSSAPAKKASTPSAAPAAKRATAKTTAKRASASQATGPRSATTAKRTVKRSA